MEDIGKFLVTAMVFMVKFVLLSILYAAFVFLLAGMLQLITMGAKSLTRALNRYNDKCIEGEFRRVN